MSLEELSQAYVHSASLLSTRLAQLRRMRREAKDPEVLFALNHRIHQLEPILTEMNDLAELTKRYYEKGYWRNEKYTL